MESGVNEVRLGAAFAFLGVLLGAFGAHALKDVLGTQGRQTYETGVLYHLVHAVAMVSIALVGGSKQIVRLFAVGIVLFSGSLYLLSVTGAKLLGAVTPFGGLAFLVGWAWLALKGVKLQRLSKGLVKVLHKVLHMFQPDAESQ